MTKLTENRAFVHGHTYQGHPIACAAALEIQKIIKEEKLMENVQKMGKLLSERLYELLSSHPNVGDIRGRGLFWGIEFVSDKATRQPFPVANNVAMEIAELGLTKPYGIAIYPGTGTADGIDGDHFIVSPAYNITADEIEEIATITHRLVVDYFEKKETTVCS
jgi:adenosylmethionine-8-amino-7-oxononanoate aminotransferase